MQLNAKIKVLLAEDEPVLRRGVLEQLERLDIDFMVTAEADNGVQALKKMQEQTPDVLIADIKMPEMDGVELVRQVRLRYPKVKTVILSGYSDFSYTQQAIRYGVSHYLLKPVSDDALQEVLQELKSEVLAEQYRPKRMVTRSANYREHGTDLSYMIFSICAGNLCYDAEDQYMQEYYAGYTPLNWEEILSGLAAGITDWQVSDEEMQNVKLIACRVPASAWSDAAHAAQCLQKRVQAHWSDVPVTVCYSRSVISKDEVWMYSQRLRNLLYQRLVPGHGQLLCLEEDELRCSDEVLGIVKMRVNDQLRQSIEKNDEAQIRSELEMIFKYMSDRAIAQRDMQKIITYIIRLCELVSGVDADSGYKQVMRTLCCACDAQLLPRQMVNAVMKIFWPGEGTGDLAAQLVEYIDRHFIQLEQLESITGVFHYNYAYLSRLFKKQTGFPINKYVLEKRLNLSMQLIENNETLNIAQIAALSGFSDRRYFLRAFKAYTNMSPSEYKNSIILKG